MSKQKMDAAGKPVNGRRRKADTAQSKFEKWVLDMGGTGTIANLLGCNQTTVVAWCFRRSTPKLEYASRLVKLSQKPKNIKLTGTPIDYEDILEGTKLW